MLLNELVDSVVEAVTMEQVLCGMLKLVGCEQSDEKEPQAALYRCNNFDSLYEFYCFWHVLRFLALDHNDFRFREKSKREVKSDEEIK